jgi:cytochrome c
MRKSLLVAALAAAIAAPAAMAFDEAAAKAFAKNNDCFKCHAPDKTKKGPSYTKITEKYKGKADAMEKLYKHSMTTQKVKLEDGTEEEHKALDPKDADKIRNLHAWILSHK